MLSSSGRSTDSMQISLGLSREAKVQNRFDVGDIEPSRNDISGYQIIHSSHLEIFHRLEAICLFQVAVYLGAFEPKDGKKRVETGALNLLIGEYDYPLFETPFENCDERRFSFHQVLVWWGLFDSVFYLHSGLVDWFFALGARFLIIAYELGTVLLVILA